MMSYIADSILNDNKNAKSKLISKIPSNNKDPNPIEDLIVPGKKLPASVIPICSG